MTAHTAEILVQLNTLLRLTSNEASTARARVSQAGSDAVRRELTANAAKCDERVSALREAIVSLGGAPDVVGLAVSRVGTAARLPLEQGVPLTEAILADLALEHQLFDRARYLKVLAHAGEEPKVVKLAQRLEDAHGETIQWLFTVLGETALGGPAALVPTGTQTVAQTARTTVTFAGSAYVRGLNSAAAAAQRLTSSAGEAVSGQVGRVRTVTDSARKVLVAGRNAALGQFEREAKKDGAKDTAGTVHQVRENLGVVGADELPVEGYDALGSKQAADAVRDLSSVEAVRTVLAYERNHKARTQVVNAAEKRVSDIASDLVNR